MASSSFISCRWDWCRSTFPNIDALDAHVKHDHIWPMNPMRKAEIVLMRKMDLQSLHSSQNTDSSIISRGLLSRITKTPQPVVPLASSSDQHLESDAFDTFTQLSSPIQTHSPQKLLPVSPAFESLMKQNGPSGLSAAVEMFERNHGHLSHQRSFSQCSAASSLEVVEQHLTQEDSLVLQPFHPPDFHIDDELADAELTWPTDDELAAEAIPDLEQPASEQNYRPGSSLGSARGQAFHCGSLSISLGVNSNDSPPGESQAPSQPLVLQTQAPYCSQIADGSQSQ